MIDITIEQSRELAQFLSEWGTVTMQTMASAKGIQILKIQTDCNKAITMADYPRIHKFIEAYGVPIWISIKEVYGRQRIVLTSEKE